LGRPAPFHPHFPTPKKNREKRRFWEASGKKTYLTFVYLTAVFINKINGFAPEKNTGPACVKILMVML
jgi:hypothetical protein